MTVSQWDAAAISLYRRFCAGDVTPAEMAVELPPIWRFRSDRDPLHGPVAWQAMVEHAGYFCWGPEGGRPGRRPRRRHRLFRGAVPQRRQGMSWTTNPAIARWFAEHRQVPAEVGLVLQRQLICPVVAHRGADSGSRGPVAGVRVAMSTNA